MTEDNQGHLQVSHDEKDALHLGVAAEETLEIDSVEVLAADKLPFLFAKNHQLTFYRGQQGELPLTIFHTEKTEISALLEACRHAGQALPLEEVDAVEFEKILTEAYQQDSSEAQQMMEDIGNEMDLFTLAEEMPQTEDLLESEDDAPIIRLINALLSEAIKEEASDIHIETYEQQLIVRFRVDGVLREVLRPNRKLSNLLVSRIKVMAKLDIAEKRVPQDGRISLRIGGRAVDLRVSTMPSSHGERVVLRLLDKNAGRLVLKQLGMSDSIRQEFNALIRKPHGIILVTGPTGSGKSTTLYAGINEINCRDLNILTVEDPIEYDIEGIGQTQVNTKVDMTFARGLKAILRQDPDVVMVGEIRDLETGAIAVQASLTGHLVMSTLHTNTASGSITRLQDMGVEPFLVSSSLLGVLAQRLIRTLCPTCKLPHVADAGERELLGCSDDEGEVIIYRANGCEECNQHGYKGRTGIHELLVVDETVRQLIHDGGGEMAIEKYIRTQTPSIRQDGCSKVLAGQTTLEEVMRVTREE
ncbi:type II secretion system ATPase GspE [Paraferrimonas sp. SM1919]|uniref:type II secretion system ATPase GspE n=1 Tax=Paraferrimonas sp. SM1919 TaxID=2662263 RepID=UPI0013D51809|nr:type II secretion system ATPase GspE [Paraferrimonas sp. SM1919]